MIITILMWFGQVRKTDIKFKRRSSKVTSGNISEY